MGAHLIFWTMVFCLVALGLIGLIGLIRLYQKGLLKWNFRNAVHAWLHHAVEAVSPVMKPEDEDCLHPDLHEETLPGQRSSRHGLTGSEPHRRYHRETNK